MTRILRNGLPFHIAELIETSHKKKMHFLSPSLPDTLPYVMDELLCKHILIFLTDLQCHFHVSDVTDTANHT